MIHTAVGILFLIPFLWYQIRHWLDYRHKQMNNIKISGYISMVAIIVALFSGVILTWQAAFGLKIDYTWKNIHLISTFVLLASVLPHILLLVARSLNARRSEAIKQNIRAQRLYGFNSLYIVFIQFAIVGLFLYVYKPPELMDKFPEDYEFPHGTNNPFAPSLAATSTMNVIDPLLLGGSQTCGSSGCHEQITQEWEVSAHRYAAADPFFRKVQEAMGEEKGAAATRYCAGCHDPISLFAGTKNLYSDALTNKTGLNEGVSCISCHSIVQVDERGNADYVIEPPKRYLFELSDNEAAKWISDFLIRSYPDQHVKSFDRSLFKSSEYCSSCHKQFLDEQINSVGWVQLQNQFDPWKESHWFTEGDKTNTVECRECHMPLVPSLDPARGDAMDYNRSPDDNMHRSHRFLGSNQFVPLLLDLPNAEEQVKKIELWLRGELEIPEIAHKWEQGPAVPIQIMTSDSISIEEDLNLLVLITNKKPGHDFPTGPLDIIQSWLEITVEDQNGNILFTSGHLDEDHFIEPGSFIFRAEPVDQYNNPIDRHNLWDMVGVRYSRALYPGKSDLARYSVAINHQVSENGLHELADYSIGKLPYEVSDIFITAKLQYRKINQFLMQNVYNEMLNVETAPVTTLSEDSKHIRIINQESR
ncbi:MAG: multiheme c-type cytochrome [Balneolaceae bacterium]